MMINPKPLKFLLALAVAGALFTVSGQADAACVNDDDCPEPACGGQVCDWNRQFTCHPAGDPAVPGQDGWCTDDSDCKCRDQGARCVNFYCTFTKPRPGTGSGGATGSSGGASGSSGGSTGSTGGAAAGTGGSTSGSGGSTSGSGGSTSGSGGATSGSGGATTGSGGSTSGPGASGGGCSVAGSAASLSSIAALLALAGLATFGRRGRRD